MEKEKISGVYNLELCQDSQFWFQAQKLHYTENGLRWLKVQSFIEIKDKK